MASSSTLLFVCYSSPPSSVHSLNKARNEEICSIGILWSRVPSRTNEARIGFTLSAESRKRSRAIQHTGVKIQSLNTANRANNYKVELGCRDYSALIYSENKYLNRRCINECCTRINVVIYGYWMGPDIEDGWGYTEAFVDPSV